MSTERPVTETKRDADRYDEEVIVNGPLLAQIFRRRLWLWIVVGLICFALLLAAILYVMPESYTATTSVVIQTPLATTGSLEDMLGIPQGGTQYLGILKSRRAATEVERHAHLQQLYHLSSAEAAIDLLMGSVKPEDSPTDGLVYISVKLPAPPRLKQNTGSLCDNIKIAAMNAANAYAAALRYYYATSDTDRETVLLRAADSEERQARSDYNTSLAKALNFSSSHDVDPRATTLTAADPSNAAPSDLADLYTALFQVEDQIRDAQAVQAVKQRDQSLQLGSIGSIPSEDPLLTEARGLVNKDQASLKTLSAIYGPQNPRVIAAKVQLQVDQAELNRQIKGIKSNLTTDQVVAKAQLKGLNARQAEILQQIALTKSRTGATRRLAGEYARLQQEVTFTAAILQTATADAVKIRMENASAMSRMQVIDEAVLPKTESPSLTLPIAFSVFVVCLGILIAWLQEYLFQQRLLIAAPPVGRSPNGVVHGVDLERDEVSPTV